VVVEQSSDEKERKGEKVVRKRRKNIRVAEVIAEIADINIFMRLRFVVF
jgi:hypothetical protein